MKCIYCGSLESKVIDSRLSEDGTTIRRRRECGNCKARYTTYEKIELAPVMVVKSDGKRQPFDPNKIKFGILKACEKRPISMTQVDEIVLNIEKEINNSLQQEISSKKIGEMVMNGLRNLDQVAYVRFASVHREFKDLNTLLEEIQSLVGQKTE